MGGVKVLHGLLLDALLKALSSTEVLDLTIGREAPSPACREAGIEALQRATIIAGEVGAEATLGEELGISLMTDLIIAPPKRRQEEGGETTAKVRLIPRLHDDPELGGEVVPKLSADPREEAEQGCDRLPTRFAVAVAFEKEREGKGEGEVGACTEVAECGCRLDAEPSALDFVGCRLRDTFASLECAIMPEEVDAPC